MDHSFNINVAKKLGVAPAVILNNLYWWIDKNRTNGIICLGACYGWMGVV